jgi:DNA-binding IclR family transcriptional regulator
MTDKMPMGKQTVSDEEILEAFEHIRGGFASATEIAEEFDHTRQWAHKRLVQLVESGELVRKQSSGNSVVYWPA